MIYRPKNVSSELEPGPIEGEGKELGHNFGHRGKTHYYSGKPREDYHPYDRKSGTGRGREVKREGHGKGNWGSYKQVYKKKGESAEQEDEPIVELKDEAEYQLDE